MSNGNWTKGKLKIDIRRPALLFGANNKIVATAESEGVGGEEALANAEHILLCWNAFEEDSLVDKLLAVCRDLALPCLESSHQLHIGLKKLGQPVPDIALAGEEKAIKLLKQAIAKAGEK